MSEGVHTSDDTVLESILTDIPLFCVGVFSIGIFTVLLSINRVDLLSAYVFIFSFLGFVAAILDLGQILLRGRSNAANSLKLEDVLGFIRAREALLSVSIGFTFLFWWTFVSYRPRGENGSSHCADWSRWGPVGLVLKWSSLAICLLITVLQLVWRLAARYTNIYVTSATLEIALSVIFVLKILLNLYLTPSESQRRFLLSHIAPILALLIGAGLGAGNLALFAFSETALGRFLRAVEVYIILVYGLFVTFRSPPKPTPSIDKRATGLVEKPRDVQSAPRLSFVKDRRDTPAAKASSWLSARLAPETQQLEVIPTSALSAVRPSTEFSSLRTRNGLHPPSSIDDLLQQQSELDRSISVLRGLHGRQRDRDRTFPTTPSDFSLSDFPEPPPEGEIGLQRPLAAERGLGKATMWSRI